MSVIPKHPGRADLPECKPDIKADAASLHIADDEAVPPLKLMDIGV